jgi:antitoxin HicB
MKRALGRSSSAVDRYVSLPYHISLVQDGDENNGKWMAAVEELPACSSRATTPEEALAGIKNAMAGWIADALREGRDIPKPRSTTSHSGRLLLRMPRTLHSELTRVAEREGVSLNHFITDSLASAVGWRRGVPPTEAGDSTGPIQEPGAEGLTATPLARESARPSSRSWRVHSGYVTAALTANFVLVALASIVAILVLIAAAWQ